MDHPHKCEHRHSLSCMEIMAVHECILNAAGKFNLDGGLISRSDFQKPADETLSSLKASGE